MESYHSKWKACGEAFEFKAGIKAVNRSGALSERRGISFKSGGNCGHGHIEISDNRVFVGSVKEENPFDHPENHVQCEEPTMAKIFEEVAGIIK